MLPILRGEMNQLKISCLAFKVFLFLKQSAPGKDAFPVNSPVHSIFNSQARI